MSKYVSEIITDIKTNSETWVRLGSNGLTKGSVKIIGFGNTWLLSVADVQVNGIATWSFLSFWDKIKLERTFKWWMRSATLEMLNKQHNDQ